LEETLFFKKYIPYWKKHCFVLLTETYESSNNVMTLLKNTFIVYITKLPKPVPSQNAFMNLDVY